MKKKKITESMGVHDKWYVDAPKQTLKSLPAFIKHLLEDYHHDYGTICHAMTAGGIATMWAMDNHPQARITGFQAGAIMWEFIRHWNYSDNKTGMRLIDYDKLLYPQYAGDFLNTISPSTYKALQKQAKIKLKEKGIVHPSVKLHWKKIVQGHVPFGFIIKNS